MTPPSPRSVAFLRRGLACTALLALWAFATGLRWRHLHEVTLGSDALGQFLGAWTVINGGAPVPPNPEAGHSLWVWGLPCVVGASTLEQVFAIRFALGALVAPIGALAAARLAGEGLGWRAWLAGLLAGIALAWDPGLIGTLVVSFRGYGAPELVTVALLGAAMGGRVGLAMGAAAFVGATGQHPMSAGVGVGLLAFLVAGKDRKHTLFVFVVAGLCALPRLHWLWQLGSCGAGLLECLGNVATGSAEPGVAATEMVRRAFWDRGVVELGLGASGAVLVGVAAAGTHRRGRRIALAAVLAVVGVLVLGLTIQGLRPYHLRAAMPVLVVAAAVGLSLRPAWISVAGVALLAGGLRWTAPLGAPGDLAAVDALGQALMTETRPVRVEAVWFGDPVGVEPAGVVLAARQAGLEVDQLTVDPSAPVILLVNLSDGDATVSEPPLHPVLDPIARQEVPRTRVARFNTVAEARAWIAEQPSPPVVTGGSFDWVKAMVPGAGSYPSL